MTSWSGRAAKMPCRSASCIDSPNIKVGLVVAISTSLATMTAFLGDRTPTY